MNLAHIIKKPIITEKSLQDASKGVFTFEVAKNASKHQIAQAISNYYKVDVTSVRTTIIPAKEYTAGRRRQTRVNPARKKARIELKSGQKIDLFEIEEA